SGISITVVTPPAAALILPVSKPSQCVRPGSLKCTCGSMHPGRTSRFLASITSPASGRSAGSTSATTRPPAIATVAGNAPVSVATRPPAIAVSVFTAPVFHAPRPIPLRPADHSEVILCAPSKIYDRRPVTTGRAAEEGAGPFPSGAVRISVRRLSVPSEMMRAKRWVVTSQPMDEQTLPHGSAVHDPHHRGDGPAPPVQHGSHMGHGEHAMHTPAMFRDRLALSVILTLPILYFSDPVQQWLGFRAVRFPGSAWVTPVLSVVIYVYGGWVFVQGAWAELAGRSPGMMTLVALAITVAFVFSGAVSLGLPGMPFYFELATLIDVMLLGHWMELLSVQGASSALEHLAALIPLVAHRASGADIQDVPVGELSEGDRILIRPGEQIPADGVVDTGASSVNEAFLTG